jgi:hypothetical protein
MSQSGLMVAALLGGFVVFLAMQGKLGNYWSILMGGGASAPSTSSGSGTTTPAPSPSTGSGGSGGSGSTSPTTPASPFSFLGGTANPFAAATGGVSNTGTANAGAAIGVPNISLGQFFGLGGG